MKNSWLKWLAVVVGLVVIGFICLMPRTRAKLEERHLLKALQAEKQKELADAGVTNAESYLKYEINQNKQIETELKKFEESNNVPITFYGKVVDQHNQPVPDVQVVMDVNKFNTEILAIPVTVSTDAEGQFTIANQSGQYLTVHNITKEGYVFHPGTSPFPGAQDITFHYSAITTPFVPNARHPALFQLWKKNPVEPITQQAVGVNMMADGSSHNVDLLKGEFDTSVADLRVSVKHPAKITIGMPYEWTFTIDAVDGGIVEAQDPYMYEAPDKGYQPGYEYFTPSVSVFNRATWRGDMQKKFYLKSRSGKIYAALEVQVYPLADDRAAVDVKAQINPAGSRNLQSDSSN